MTTIEPVNAANSVRGIFESMSYGPAPEGDAPVREWLKANDSAFGHYINGRFTRAADSELFDVHDPSSGKLLARVAQGTSADVDAAVAAARAALPAWQALEGHARARYLYSLARAVQRHSRIFAVLESMDNGKPI